MSYNFAQNYIGFVIIYFICLISLAPKKGKLDDITHALWFYVVLSCLVVFCSFNLDVFWVCLFAPHVSFFLPLEATLAIRI
jgi:uncharacterized membrane protein